MSTSIETAANLARECQAAGIVAATVSAPHSAGEPFNKIRIRPIQLKNGAFFQLEQFGGTKAFHRNVTAEELAGLLEGWLSSTYGRAEIVTATATIQVFAKPGGELKVLRRKNTAPTTPAVQNHDRAKHYILPEGQPVPFLVDLGIMAKDGTVIKAMYHKFRQVNRFLEFIADILPELRLAATASGRPADHPLTIVDFGCGKGYLTFATYHYLAVLHGLPVRMIGLDLKAEVMQRCSALARQYGYAGLQFEQGDIGDWQGVEAADMVVSLHACDTASDLALAKAMAWQARIILAAPCCQHELNAQLADKSSASPAPGRQVLQAAFKHGIIRERLAALFTDVLRAELLESKGYQTQIMEFIEMDHTPKNLLIRAVKHQASTPVEPADYRELRDFLGVQPMLEKLAGKA